MGATHDGNFYCTWGSLDPNEITCQFIDLLTSYEPLGISILGIVVDAGGGNAWFFQ